MAFDTTLGTTGFWMCAKMRRWLCVWTPAWQCAVLPSSARLCCVLDGDVQMSVCKRVCLFHPSVSLCGLCLELSELPCWFHVVFQNHYQWPLRTGSHGTFCTLPAMHESLCPHPPLLCSAAHLCCLVLVLVTESLVQRTTSARIL